MTRSAPYQPLLLRILHGISGILVITAIITGFLVYNTFDQRFGKIPLPKIDPIQDIHGTVALCFLLLLPAFALYSFHAGEKRLLQPDSLQKLTQVGKPIWWVSLQRIVNTLMLIASVWAVISGRMMKEEWLPIGELDHLWYYFHLIAWVIMVCCLAIHLLMSAKVGGAPLLLSMWSGKFRPGDSPRNWYSRLRTWSSNFYQNFSAGINQLIESNFSLRIIEVFVLLGIIAAFVSPLFFSGVEK
ncbi:MULTISPECIES: cytochrome b/b6 domain-containing protein [Cyanophyceae]|uniref:cytochrome b/b6 domain-containing protein n=1 Tax=Cyanophyceae TaxID=3028117 RepID=UPI00232B5B8D|nr:MULTISPECIES: cytochrome b/b6 domain-containing protein [Cyanophyceae]MDB9356779.1 cytochrome b/b6 domain-containing protein [Nodularia spumigena CS-587/03]MDB9305462.1 cytochrome b/b6 domain-containing protein [Nodularia spumigena CS-591/12]MDB9319436.1 cytochrome b/b6 domain-containing protein [Nodularia spumigena CS-590/01A]MDB9324354.1 cytochrome b/b6 domain-containing protein [Nodularia spumigena CS-591/07A]MDB9325191.1 cytochrome b/b6 domain-containing protein [Nodularia spumigena CS-